MYLLKQILVIFGFYPEKKFEVMKMVIYVCEQFNILYNNIINKKIYKCQKVH